MFFTKEIIYKSELGYQEIVNRIAKNIESDYSLEMAIRHKKPKKPFIGFLNNNGTFEIKNVQMHGYRNMSYLIGNGRLYNENGSTTISVSLTLSKGLRTFLILFTVFSLVLLIFANFIAPLVISLIANFIAIQTCYQEFKVIKNKLDLLISSQNEH